MQQTLTANETMPAPQQAAHGLIRRLQVNAVLSGSLFVLALIVVVAALAPLLSPYQWSVPDYAAALNPPGPRHLLGTDQFGRDIFTRLMYGARVTLLIATGATAVATVIGMGLGLVAGYVGGMLDAIIGRVIDALFAFPALLLAIALTAILQPSESTAALAITIIIMPEFARVARNVMLVEKTREYVEASRSLGSPAPFIIVRSILPNLRGPLLVLLSNGFSYAVLYEAALSFLGLGAQPPVPSWGAMLNDGRSYLFVGPWYAFSAGIAIFLLLLTVNMLGDSLRQITGVDAT